MIRFFRAFAALALAGLLSACVLTSTTLFITDDEAATPLPSKVYLYGYDDKEDGGFVRSSNAPLVMNQDGKTYVADDGSLNARFVPLDSTTYLLAATSKDNTIYGLTRFSGELLDLKVILGSNAEAAFKAAAIPGVTFKSEGTDVASREALNAAIELMRNGTIETASLVFFFSDKPDAAAPAGIVRDGDGLKAN